MIRQAKTMLTIETAGAGLTEITRQVAAWAGGTAIADGLLTLFIRHTSASLLIQENAAPAAARDVEAYFARLAPESVIYEHDDEGSDDMPAHLRATLTQTHLAIPLIAGHLALVRWQGIYLFEHRHRPHRREIALHLIGE